MQTQSKNAAEKKIEIHPRLSEIIDTKEELEGDHSHLSELLDQVVANKERLTLTYGSKVFLAMVPIEDVELIEQLEECIDAKIIQEALEEAEEMDTFSLEQLEKELGW